MAEVGEYVVGAWLQEVASCSVVTYNVRPPNRGTSRQAEFDVIGFDFENRIAYMCEVATHLGGLNYGNGYQHTINRIQKKFDRQREYATDHLGNFDEHKFMLWAPNVPRGTLTDRLGEIPGLELVMNSMYRHRVRQLEEIACKTVADTGNPFFRSLQILTHLRDG